MLAAQPGAHWAAGCAGGLLLAMVLVGRRFSRCRPQLMTLARVIAAWGIAHALLIALGDADITRNIANLGLVISGALATLSLLLLGRPKAART